MKSFIGCYKTSILQNHNICKDSLLVCIKAASLSNTELWIRNMFTQIRNIIFHNKYSISKNKTVSGRYIPISNVISKRCGRGKYDAKLQIKKSFITFLMLCIYTPLKNWVHHRNMCITHFLDSRICSACLIFGVCCSQSTSDYLEGLGPRLENIDDLQSFILHYYTFTGHNAYSIFQYMLVLKGH